MDKDISTEQKTWQVYNLGKRNVFRLDLNESGDGFCRRGRGRSFQVDGPKTEKEREPTTNTDRRGRRRQIEKRMLNGTDIVTAIKDGDVSR